MNCWEPRRLLKLLGVLTVPLEQFSFSYFAFLFQGYEFYFFPSTFKLFGFQHNLCTWPQCDQPCENFATFLHHLATVHTLDERSAQQCRAQIEVVDNLEHRLNRERTRLQAMMQHLHMKQSPDTTTPTLGTLQQSQDSTSIPSPTLAEPKTESLPDQVGHPYWLLSFGFWTL